MSQESAGMLCSCSTYRCMLYYKVQHLCYITKFNSLTLMVSSNEVFLRIDLITNLFTQHDPVSMLARIHGDKRSEDCSTSEYKVFLGFDLVPDMTQIQI